MKSSTKLLIAILLVATAIRFLGVTVHDAYTDEVLLGFRSIGLIDYVTAPYQTTPWQWFEYVPWWAHFSFHDHPKLFFLVQHVTILLFGETMLALRLPAVLAGIASVYVTYLLGARLVSRRAGYVASGLLAVNSYHIWGSRIGIQDGVVLFWVLLFLYCYLRALEDRRYWYVAGVVAGLGLLTKYTFVFAFVLVALHAVVYRRPLHKNGFAWRGALIAFVLSSPILLYNLFLYKNVGHFDFQLSALLGQETSQWTVRFGRELTGGFTSRGQNFFRVISDTLSPLFTIASALAFCYLFVLTMRKRTSLRIYLLTLVPLIFLWGLSVGSAYRFLLFGAVLLCLILGWAAESLVARYSVSTLVTIIVIVLVSTEGLFSINTYLLKTPVGSVPLMHAAVAQETKNFGYEQLEIYLTQFLDGKHSGLFGQNDHNFITQLQQSRLDAHKVDRAEPMNAVIVYDSRMNYLARLWVFVRRLIYDGWPVLSDDQFVSLTGDSMDTYYKDQGVDHILYVHAVSESTHDPMRGHDHDAQALYDHLHSRGIEPVSIWNRAGELAFEVYHF